MRVPWSVERSCPLLTSATEILFQFPRFLRFNGAGSSMHPIACSIHVVASPNHRVLAADTIGYPILHEPNWRLLCIIQSPRQIAMLVDVNRFRFLYHGPIIVLPRKG